VVPALLRAKSTINAKIVNADIAPTLLELAAIKKPKDMQGESFVHVLKNNKEEHRKDLFYHYFENGEHAVSPHFGVRDDRYKLIRYYKRIENWELFDLQKDPNELHNVYKDPTYQSVVKLMKRNLITQMRQFDDKKQKLFTKSTSTNYAIRVSDLLDTPFYCYTFLRTYLLKCCLYS
jgi:arylsulfatase A-like enzyme